MSFRSTILLLFCLIHCVSCDSNAAGYDLIELSINHKDLTMDNGILKFRNKPFTGVIKSFDPVNQTNNESEYVNGKKEGLELKRYKDAVLAEERYYKEGLKVNIHRGYWPDGSLKFEYHFNQKGFYQGSCREWYSNGQLLKDFRYQNGQEDGPQKMWRSDGKIRANYVVRGGERFGLIGLKKCYTVNKKNENI